MTTVVSIVSPRQSGSTILTYLLGSHPGIATVGEIQLPENNALCSCGENYTECMFWCGVVDGMSRRGFSFDIRQSDLEFIPGGDGVSDIILRTAVRGPLLEMVRNIGLASVPRARREFDRLLRRNEAFIEVVAGLKGCEIFLDSTKRASRALHLQRSPKLDVKIIHLIRDGRANSWSAMRHGNRSAAEAATHWLVTHMEAERFRRYFAADRWIDIRHEDLCARPKEVLAQLHQFIGVEGLPQIGDFRTNQHILGNSRTRTSSSNEIVLDERWKSDLTSGELGIIEGILGDMNRQYGYLPIMAH